LGVISVAPRTSACITLGSTSTGADARAASIAAAARASRRLPVVGHDVACARARAALATFPASADAIAAAGSLRHF
jgi:hypothetical protein